MDKTTRDLRLIGWGPRGSSLWYHDEKGWFLYQDDIPVFITPTQAFQWLKEHYHASIL